MNVTLWIVQGLLAFAFIAFGGMKLFAYEKFKVMSEKNGPTGITRGLTTFIGIAELAGGIGIVPTPGYRPFVRDLQITPGQTVKLDIRLEEGIALNTLGDGRAFFA